MARKSRAPSAPPRDLGLEAYDRLKAAIRDATFPSGTRLTEAELSVWLGMSRTPTREALHRLETDGLVGHEPRRGLTVTRPDHQTIVELYVMRETLEGKAAGLAAHHAGDAEIEAMGELVAAELDCQDAAARSAVNHSLHRLIHVSAHNRFLLRSLSALSDTMTLLPTMLGDPARAAQSYAEHRDVLAAILRRDTAGAEEAMRVHLRSAQRHRVSALAHKP
ncbi:GntR family transcriptional regulator [Acidisphaera sp. L21]|jgi:DNA-binding GntR family transcriptional regulator|uniref:GntR family transcriptional regulator n=1 Tax=Acidisphaera sp. L21 TaxID=1641851 RepID=UPI00131E2276|nr:GntR family transcriptional regulator [Acidisphaera sp. L21]